MSRQGDAGAHRRRGKRRALFRRSARAAKRRAGITTSATTAPSWRALAKGKSVLDAYCYAGGFAIAAAKVARARSSASILRSPRLRLAEEAAAANKRQRATSSRPMCSKKLERSAPRNENFDIVVADPPPFVKSRKDLEAGAKAYRKLARLAGGWSRARRVSVAGVVLAQHRLERFAYECAIGIARTGRKASLIRQAGAGARPSGASDAAGDRLSKGAGLRFGLNGNLGTQLDDAVGRQVIETRGRQSAVERAAYKARCASWPSAGCSAGTSVSRPMKNVVVSTSIDQAEGARCFNAPGTLGVSKKPWWMTTS